MPFALFKILMINRVIYFEPAGHSEVMNYLYLLCSQKI